MKKSMTGVEQNVVVQNASDTLPRYVDSRIVQTERKTSKSDQERSWRFSWPSSFSGAVSAVTGIK